MQLEFTYDGKVKVIAAKSDGFINYTLQGGGGGAGGNSSVSAGSGGAGGDGSTITGRVWMNAGENLYCAVGAGGYGGVRGTGVSAGEGGFALDGWSGGRGGDSGAPLGSTTIYVESGLETVWLGRPESWATQFLKDYGIWSSDLNSSTFDRTFMFFCQTAGSYTLKAACGLQFTIYIDDDEALSGSNWGTVYSSTITISAGYHAIRLVGSSFGATASIAATITDSIGVFLFNSRAPKKYVLTTDPLASFIPASGGGGGGATLIWKVVNGEQQIIAVAGGGGGGGGEGHLTSGSPGSNVFSGAYLGAETIRDSSITGFVGSANDVQYSLGVLQNVGQNKVIEFKIPGTSYYTIPAGVTQISIVTIGAGGGGSGGGGDNADAGMGGYSGAMNRAVIDVTPGSQLEMSIGYGGAGGSGQYAGSNSMSANAYGKAGGATYVRYNGTQYALASGGGQQTSNAPGGGGTAGSGASSYYSTLSGRATSGSGNNWGSGYPGYVGGGGGGGGSPHSGFQGYGYGGAGGAGFVGIALNTAAPITALITKNSIPFRNGIIPILNNFKFDYDGLSPSEDLLLIGADVTQADLSNYGITTAIANIPKVKPGQRIYFSSEFVSPGPIKLGYWIWDSTNINPLSTQIVPLTTELSQTTYDQRKSITPYWTRIFKPAYWSSLTEVFNIPFTFTSKSILVFGIGDTQKSALTGLKNVIAKSTIYVNKDPHRGGAGSIPQISLGAGVGGGGGGWEGGMPGSQSINAEFGGWGGSAGESYNIGEAITNQDNIIQKSDSFISTGAGGTAGSINGNDGNDGYAGFASLSTLMKCKVGTEWKEIENVKIKNKGNFVSASDAYVRVNGAWKSLFGNKNLTYIDQIDVFASDLNLDWDSGTVGVSSQGKSTITLPRAMNSILIRHRGGWGQSNEVGKIYVRKSSGDTVVSLSEGSGITLTAGKDIFQVSANGTETRVTTFPGQSQDYHTIYIEIQNVDDLRYITSDGAPGAKSHPTSFYDMRIMTNYDRMSIIKNLSWPNVYYVIR